MSFLNFGKGVHRSWIPPAYARDNDEKIDDPLVSGLLFEESVCVYKVYYFVVSMCME